MSLLSNLWKEITNYTWTGIQPSIPYDTAWVSSLSANSNDVLFTKAQRWVLEHQHKDGSWGFQRPYFFMCEQMTSTLASIQSLNSSDKIKFACEIDRGVNWVNENISKLESYLHEESVKTAGFELIFPGLLNNLEDKVNFTFDASKFNVLKEEKLSKIPLPLITNARTPLLYSIEFLSGLDLPKKVNLDYLLSRDGSISTSPSASAYYLSLKPKTSEYIYNFLQKAQNYDGGFPAYNSGGVFSIAYSLYILQKNLGNIPSKLKYILRLLDLNWTPMGVGIGENFAIQDIDDTALTLKLLTDGNFLTPRKKVAYWNVLDSYFNEKGGYFLTFPYENDPSFLANIHVLDALQSNVTKKNLYFEPLLSFLEKEVQKKSTFSKDKYYYSPYLQNARALMVFSDIAPHLASLIYDWFLKAQREDNLWGETPNVEELSHVVQALSYYNLNAERIDLSVLDESIKFINNNLAEKNSQYLWIAKSFYAPIEVITSNIFSALYSYNQSQKMVNHSYLPATNILGASAPHDPSYLR